MVLRQVLWRLGMSLQGFDVGWHLHLRLAADHERREQPVPPKSTGSSRRHRLGLPPAVSQPAVPS